MRTAIQGNTRSFVSAAATARNGSTLIEALVVMGVISLLCALILPAVQYSRERGRCMMCASNMRQIGLAFQNFESTNGHLPIGWNTFREILPQIENPALRDAINGNGPVNFSAKLFVCPSDPLAVVTEGHVSYLLNEGTGYQRYGNNGVVLALRGDINWTHSRDIVDGLSNTACVAESLIRPYRTSRDEFDTEPRRALWYTPVTRSGWGELDAFRELCRTSRVTPLPSIRSHNQLITGMGYNHILGPNSVGCHNGPAGYLLNWNFAAIPASSLHRGGVNVLFADGSVRFMTDTISTAVWNAVGSRNGGDTE